MTLKFGLTVYSAAGARAKLKKRSPIDAAFEFDDMAWQPTCVLNVYRGNPNAPVVTKWSSPIVWKSMIQFRTMTL